MHDLFDMLGIKGPVVVAGLAGGVLRALSRHRYKLREMIASPICGALAAAFLIGVSAMWISDIVFEVIVRRFKPAGDK